MHELRSISSVIIAQAFWCLREVIRYYFFIVIIIIITIGIRK